MIKYTRKLMPNKTSFFCKDHYHVVNNLVGRVQRFNHFLKESFSDFLRIRRLDTGR